MKTGRPQGSTILNEKLINEITDNLGSGMTIYDACLFAGVSVSSFKLWRKKGKNAKMGIYHDFWKAIKSVFDAKEEFAQARAKLALERAEKKMCRKFVGMRGVDLH